MNGGTCVAPELCDCVTGWTGTYCENGLFLQLHQEYIIYIYYAYTAAVYVHDETDQ